MLVLVRLVEPASWRDHSFFREFPCVTPVGNFLEISFIFAFAKTPPDCQNRGGHMGRTVPNSSSSPGFRVNLDRLVFVLSSLLGHTKAPTFIHDLPFLVPNTLARIVSFPVVYAHSRHVPCASLPCWSLEWGEHVC